MPELVPYKPQPKPDPLDLDASAPGRPRSATEFVGVREYLAMIRRHWWVVVLVGVASVAYSANKALKERPVYGASSTVRLVDSRRALAGDIAGRPGDAGYGFQTDPIESQIQVLQSGAVAAVAVDLQGFHFDAMPSDRGAEKAFVDLCAHFPPDPRLWRQFGEPGFLAGIAVLLAGHHGFDRTSYLGLAEALCPGSGAVQNHSQSNSK